MPPIKIHEDVGMMLSTAVLFILEKKKKSWKQSKCLQKEEQLNKLGYFLLEYCLHLNVHKIRSEKEQSNYTACVFA